MFCLQASSAVLAPVVVSLRFALSSWTTLPAPSSETSRAPSRRMTSLPCSSLSVRPGALPLLYLKTFWCFLLMLLSALMQSPAVISPYHLWSRSPAVPPSIPAYRTSSSRQVRSIHLLRPSKKRLCALSRHGHMAHPAEDDLLEFDCISEHARKDDVSQQRLRP